MSDPLLDLADGLVTALNAAGTFSLPFTAEWKDDALAELADAALRAVKVWVVDISHVRVPAGSDGVGMEEFELLVLVQRKLVADDDQPAACRALASLAGELATFCRVTPIAETVCVKTERRPARHLGEYHAKSLFYGEIKTTWRRPQWDE